MNEKKSALFMTVFLIGLHWSRGMGQQTTCKCRLMLD